MSDNPDYSAQNEPNDEELSRMMDSAIALSEIIGGGTGQAGRRWRGQPIREISANAEVVSPWNDANTPPERMNHYYLTDPDGTRREISQAEYILATQPMRRAKADVARELPPPPERAQIYAEAMAKALAGPWTLVADEREVLTLGIGTLEAQVASLRAYSGIAENPVAKHALTSIELGILGLAKVLGRE